ncbi:MAG: hypothetical protein KBE27_05500, partial [Syntrophorhabdaceae bacterium]|nr:hypothetical protein [Syntrophorhabdaceae bacterium]
MPIDRYIDRIDAIDKVTGKALYAGDFHMEGMLFAKLVRSNRPHAMIRSVDTHKALTLPGVVTILSYSDIPGKNSFGVIKKDQQLLASDRVRYIGEPILIIIAQNEKIAREAADLITIDYDDLEFIGDPSQAMRSSTLIHENGNLLSYRKVIKGDIE